MEILKLELKKVMTSKALWILMVIFISFNGYIIYEKSYVREDIKILNKIIDVVGYEINDTMMEDFEKLSKEKNIIASEIIKDKISKTYESYSDFYNDFYKYSDKFSKAEIKAIDEAAITETYYRAIDDLDGKYNSIYPEEILENVIKNNEFTKKEEEYIKVSYLNFQDRLDEIKSSGEQKNLFFIGSNYRMHSFLFKNIFGKINIELGILITMMTAFLINYEFENKTHLNVYSTKVGRNIIKDKIKASLIATVIFITILIGVTLGIFFTVFDYSGVFKVNISSFFNWEFNRPYISWFNVSFLTYLMMIIALIYIVQVIFSVITLFICKFIRNTYMVFFLFYIIYGIFILLPQGLHKNFVTGIISIFTPFTLMYNIGWRFMIYGAEYPIKYYEEITLFLWVIITLIMSFYVIRKFKKENIN